MAIMAGFERVRGHIIITMDADLQNHPKKSKMVAAMEAGHDVVQYAPAGASGQLVASFCIKYAQ